MLCQSCIDVCHWLCQCVAQMGRKRCQEPFPAIMAYSVPDTFVSNDIDGDGTDDDGTDPGVGGWTIFVDVNNDTVNNDGFSTVTADNGTYTINGIPEGYQAIREVQQAGWTHTFGFYTGEETRVNVVQETTISPIDFGNHEGDVDTTATFTIEAFKFEDVNGNGVQNSPEDVGIPGWEIVITINDTPASYFTNGSGTVLQTFELEIGDTWSITEVVTAGWTQTFDGSSSGSILTNLGDSWVSHFGNHALATIAIEKTANPTTVSEGGVDNQDVTYTYLVTQSNAGNTGLTVVVSDTDGTPTGVDVAPVDGFNDGDTNLDGLLQKTETWTYSLLVTMVADNVGAIHTNTGTATGTVGLNTTIDTDTATVTYTDVTPAISIVKTVNPTSIDEGSTGPVTYSFALTNTSTAAAVDPLTILTLTDDVLGDILTLGGVTLTKTGGDLDALLELGETWTYTVSASVPAGNVGDSHTNVATVTAEDDEGTDTSPALDDATVTYSDVAPTINVDKSANVAVVGVGQTVIYTYVLTNTSAAGAFDPLTVTSLSDNKAGDILILGTLAAGSDADFDGLLDSTETWTYTISYLIPLDYVGTTLTNTVTVVAADDDLGGADATDIDTATVVVLEKCGGRTIGFWGNKNGLALLTPADFVMLTALNLRNANGSHRDFVGTLAANRTSLENWLKNANATNMAYMLSAQLTALRLSVNHGFSTASDYVYVPALNSWSSNSQGAALLGNLNSGPGGTLTTAGFIKIGTLMTTANVALGNDGVDGVTNERVVVNSGNTQRKYYEALKNVIDGINNSSNNPGPGPICVKNIDFLSGWVDANGDGVIDRGELGINPSVPPLG